MVILLVQIEDMTTFQTKHNYKITGRSRPTLCNVGVQIKLRGAGFGFFYNIENYCKWGRETPLSFWKVFMFSLFLGWIIKHTIVNTPYFQVKHFDLLIRQIYFSCVASLLENFQTDTTKHVGPDKIFQSHLDHTGKL